MSSPTEQQKEEAYIQKKKDIVKEWYENEKHIIYSWNDAYSAYDKTFPSCQILINYLYELWKAEQDDSPCFCLCSAEDIWTMRKRQEDDKRDDKQKIKKWFDEVKEFIEEGCSWHNTYTKYIETQTDEMPTFMYRGCVVDGELYNYLKELWLELMTPIFPTMVSREMGT